MEDLRIPALGERDHLVELERRLAEFELLPDREIVEGAHSLTVHGRRDAVAPDGRVALCSAATTLAQELLTPQIEGGERMGGLHQLGHPPVPGRCRSHEQVRSPGRQRGFRCFLLAYRETGQGAVLMTNGENGNWVVQRAFVRIASAYGWPDYPQELAERDVPDDATLAAFAGTYDLRRPRHRATLASCS